MTNVVAVRKGDGRSGPDHAHVRNESLVDLIDDRGRGGAGGGRIERIEDDDRVDGGIPRRGRNLDRHRARVHCGTAEDCEHHPPGARIARSRQSGHFGGSVRVGSTTSRFIGASSLSNWLVAAIPTWRSLRIVRRVSTMP
jgi:hypothetical protein